MLKKYSTRILAGLVLFLFLLIFRHWFSFSILSTNDWPYLYPTAVDGVSPFSAWDVLFNNGLGQSSLPKIWFDSYALTIIKLANVISWPIFERVVWFIPGVLLSFFGAFFLSKKFIQDTKFNLIAGVIYSLNTYFLMLVSGGQAGVMMAYAFLPVVFIALFSLFTQTTLKRSLTFSLTLSILILLDLRVGYMFLAAEAFFVAVQLVNDRRKLLHKLLYFFIVPGCVAIVLHFFWILPILFMHRNPAGQLGEIYTSSTSLDFFSFAKLENSIALLHPNWPENIFGKVSFLRPEFLIIPILAFISLLFISSEQKSKRTSILSATLLAIGGIFLAKGTTDPYGDVYRFFFNIVPGFVMFRDPTKWYMLIAIAFSILIPYSLLKISEYIEKKWKIEIAAFLISVIFVILFAILIRDSFTGIVGGTLKPRAIPANYQALAKMLGNHGSFGRTLWVTKYPTFAYVSDTHPAVPATEFLQASSTAELISTLKRPETEKLLQDASIQFVIVPDDIDHKIFLTDRRYDERVYKKTLNGVEQIDYLYRIPGFGRIAVFKVSNPNGHFWEDGENIHVFSKSISPTKYLVDVRNAKKGDRVVFAEGYDKFWTAKVPGFEVQSVGYKLSKNVNFNSFVLPYEGSYMMEVSYKPQEWLNMGLVVSGISLAVVVFILFKIRKEK